MPPHLTLPKKMMPTSDIESGEAPSRRGAVKVLVVLLAIFGAVFLCQKFSSDKGFFLHLAFVFLVLCLDIIYVLFLFTRRLRRPLRIGITSFVIAVFITPGVVVGHGAMIVPAWMFLLSHEDQQWIRGGVIPIVVVFLIIFSIQYVFSIFLIREDKANKSWRTNRA